MHNPANNSCPRNADPRNESCDCERNRGNEMKSKTQYVYAEAYGMVYRFTPRKWRTMLGQVVIGKEVDYSDYGVLLCVIGHSITDLDQEQAQELYQEGS